MSRCSEEPRSGARCFEKGRVSEGPTSTFLVDLCGAEPPDEAFNSPPGAFKGCVQALDRASPPEIRGAGHTPTLGKAGFDKQDCGSEPADLLRSPAHEGQRRRKASARERRGTVSGPQLLGGGAELQDEPGVRIVKRGERGERCQVLRERKGLGSPTSTFVVDLCGGLSRLTKPSIRLQALSKGAFKPSIELHCPRFEKRFKEPGHTSAFVTRVLRQDCGGGLADRLRLPAHERQRWRKTPARERRSVVSGPQPLGGGAELQDEPGVGVVERPPHAVARRQEEGTRRAVEAGGPVLWILCQDRGDAEDRASRSPPFRGGFFFDLFDHLGDALPIALRRQVLPAGEG